MDSWIILLGVVPFLIGMCGQVAQKLVLGARSPKGLKGWRRVYWATLPIHAMVVGGGVGVLGSKFGVPLPEAFGKELGGYVLGYTLSGGVAVVGYDVLVKSLRRMLGSFKFVPGGGERSASLPAAEEQDSSSTPEQ